MVQFNPQKLKILIERFPKAVADTYDPMEILSKPEIRPSNKPEHIFDFEDGLRLIVNKERQNGRVVIHLSASMDAQRYTGPKDLGVMDLIIAHFRELCGSQVEPSFAFFTGGGIPHWYMDASKLN